MPLLSFNTLRLPRRVPRDLLLAVLLLVGCEVAARTYFVADGSLTQLINGYVERLNTEQPAIWICGNSTMNAGIDAEVIEQRLEGSVIKLAHGTATLRASVDLLDYYLNHTQTPPQTLIVCTFKDDLNPNGYNARVSEQFDDVLTAEVGHATNEEWLRLSGARNRISLGVQKFLSTGWRASRERSSSLESPPLEVYSGEPIVAGDPFFADAARDYEVDFSGFDRLQQLAQKYEIQRCVVMLLPTSQPYVDFHDSLYPQQTYDEIRAQLKTACADRGIAFIDQGGPWKEASLFKDPYHLNAKGRERLMDAIMPRLTPSLSFHQVP